MNSKSVHFPYGDIKLFRTSHYNILPSICQYPLKNPAECAIINMIIDNHNKFNIKRGQHYEAWNGGSAERRQKYPF